MGWPGFEALKILPEAPQDGSSKFCSSLWSKTLFLHISPSLGVTVLTSDTCLCAFAMCYL